MIHTFSTFLEAKSAGILYHFTSLFNLSQIAESNTLRTIRTIEGLDHIKALDKYRKTGNTYYFSFTRNKLLNRSSTDLDHPITCRITVDGTKLSQKFKIEPINYFDAGNKHINSYYDTVEEIDDEIKLSHTRYTSKDESEEAIISTNDELKNFSEYILTIKLPTLVEFETELKHYAYGDPNAYFMDVVVNALDGILTSEEDDDGYEINELEQVCVMCRDETFTDEHIKAIYNYLVDKVKMYYKC